jgi:protein-S-isoprenylcysteine O-methyltransferase Ste14
MLNKIRYVIAVMPLVTVPPVILLWFAIHPFARAWRRFGARGTYGILMVPALGVCWGSFTARKTLVGTDLGTRPALIVLGVAALLLAGALARARAKYLTQPILMGVPELSATDKGKLLTQGIYGRIRNPRYVEFLTFILGVAAISNHLGLWILLLASIPALELVVVLEERELRERFGAEFDEYCRRVPRWIPRSVKAGSSSHV